MGIFKDAKDAYQGARNIGNHHGGMPSIRGSFQDIAALSDDKGQNEILRIGTPARARVLGFAVPSTTEKFTMVVDLEVIPPAGEPYPVAYAYPTARQKAPLSIGMEVPVKIHPDDPTAVAVQWDALKGSIAASGGDLNAAMQGLQNTYAGTADAAGRAYLAAKEAAETASPTAAPPKGPNGEDPSDPAVRLKKLAQLRDAGLISAVEFDTKKQEILGDL